MTMVKKDRIQNAPPRAQRFDIKLPLSYRACGETTWRRGLTENVSYSGVLFWAEQSLKVSTPVEMIFEMPVEVGGEIGAEVVCQGKIVRSVLSGNADSSGLLAASIVEYRFVRGGMRSAA
jgi:hypothetical protein